jgi:predicted dinucleotide-binding enzyme
MQYKIGVIGSGQVAQVLATGFKKYGHTVMIGSRDVSKLNDWKKKSGSDIQTGSFEETARFGELIVLAVKGSVAEKVISGIASTLDGKIVMDTTNPIADAPPENGALKFFTDLNESLMERLQKKVPRGQFVKVFSSVGSSLMVNPALSDKPTMFICGNDEAAKKTVTGLLDQFGWETADMGKVEAARAIEPLCMLWCLPGFIRNEWNHAFKLLKP